MTCIHEWHSLGLGDQRVICSKCKVYASVTIDPPTTHLALAREALDQNMLAIVGRMVSSDNLPPLHRAVYEILRHLEEKEKK
jgi:hypothetical protein